jgi:hypothetical protein
MHPMQPTPPTQPMPQVQPVPPTPPQDRRPSPAPVAPVPPEVALMRASHADRERTTDVLKAAFAEGRLAPEEYNERVEQVYRAQTYGELSGIVQDLPSGPMPVPYLTPAPVVPPAFAPQPYPFAGPQPYQPYAPYAGYPAYQLGPAPYAHARPYAYPYPAPYAPPQPARRTNGLATASLVLGIMEFWTLGITGIPALICGYLARSQMRVRGEEGSGMATAGIVLGWLAVVGWGLVAVLGFTLAFHSSGSGQVPAPVPPALPGG